MKQHYSNARLIDPEGREGPGTLTVEDGLISAVTWGERAGGGIDCGGKCLAPGIIDIGVKVCEPGERHKESFRSAGLAAAAGGVTTMVTRPDTSPVIDSPEVLGFVQARARDALPVRVLPMAALTRNREGAVMAEIGFLNDAGAVAFTDTDHVCRNTQVLARCMTYARSLDVLVIAHPQDPDMSQGAAATSGAFASKLGLPGVGPVAEVLGLTRDLALAEATGVRYHADQVTTGAALDLLRAAKARGLRVTAGCSVHHLTLNEFDIGDYRTFFKVKPPLRSEADRLACVAALAEGVIDIIASMHTPQDEESKRLPFEEAASGAVALETLLPAALRLVHAGHLDLPSLFRALTRNPADLLGLPQGRLAVGAPADLVLFDPDAPFVLDRTGLHSKSRNTPFDQTRMQGRVLGTWIGGERAWPRKEP